LADPQPYPASEDEVLQADDPWPVAAWGKDGKARRADLSEWPVSEPFEDLHSFMKYPMVPLSGRAASGFLSRALRSNLRFVPGFLDDVAVAAETAG
jgi:DNA (cytosine-5)-methyltransferase 1